MSTTETYPDERRFAGQAKFEPETVSPEDVSALVEPNMSKLAGKTVRSFAAARPDALAPHADTLTDCLMTGISHRLTELYVAEALGTLAPVAPTVTDTLLSLAKSPSAITRRNAVQAIGAVADTDPTVASECHDVLIDRLTDKAGVRRSAIRTLATLAAGDPDARDRVQTTLTYATGLKRTGAARVIGVVLERCGDVSEDTVESVVDLLDDDTLGGDETSDVLRALDSIAATQPCYLTTVRPRLFKLATNQNGAATVLSTLTKHDADVFAELLARATTADPNPDLLKAVADVADRHPHIVANRADAINAALTHEDYRIRDQAAGIVTVVANENPDAAAFAIDPLLSRLSRATRDTDVDLRTASFKALGELAGQHPTVIETVVAQLAGEPDTPLGQVKSIIGVDQPASRKPAARAAEWIARNHPTLLYDAGAVPHLVDALDDGGSTAGEAAWALARISKHHPDVMATAADPITDLVVNSSVRAVPTGAYRGLVEAARHDPVETVRARDTAFAEFESRGERASYDVVGILASAFQPEFDRLTELLDEETVGNKRILLAMEAATAEDPTTAIPHVDRIAETAADSDYRSNATRVLAGIADGTADTVDSHTNLVEELVYDPDRLTRKAACTVAAGLLRGGSGEYDRLRERLATVAECDDREDVRTVAVDTCNAIPDSKNK